MEAFQEYSCDTVYRAGRDGCNFCFDIFCGTRKRDHSVDFYFVTLSFLTEDLRRQTFRFLVFLDMVPFRLVAKSVNASFIRDC